MRKSATGQPHIHSFQKSKESERCRRVLSADGPTPDPRQPNMKTTTAAVAALAVALGGSKHCGEAFLVGTPVRSSGSSAARSWATAPSSCPAAAARRDGGAAGAAATAGAGALSMVSATFGEKINTDKIVLDKTAREGIQEQYPEACEKCPTFLGQAFFRALLHAPHAQHVSKVALDIAVQLQAGEGPYWLL